MRTCLDVSPPSLTGGWSCSSFTAAQYRRQGTQRPEPGPHLSSASWFPEARPPGVHWPPPSELPVCPSHMSSIHVQSVTLGNRQLCLELVALRVSLASRGEERLVSVPSWGTRDGGHCCRCSGCDESAWKVRIVLVFAATAGALWLTRSSVAHPPASRVLTDSLKAVLGGGCVSAGTSRARTCCSSQT